MSRRYHLLSSTLLALAAGGCGGTTSAPRPDAGACAVLPQEEDPGSGPILCSEDSDVELSPPSVFLQDFESGLIEGGWYLNNDVCNVCNNLQLEILDGGTPEPHETHDQLKVDLENCNACCAAGANKPVPTEILPSPRCDSRYALHVRGGPYANWGGVIGIQWAPARPLDASQWTGLAFWGRVAPGSRTTMNIQVSERHTNAMYVPPVCITNQTRDQTRSGCDTFGSYAIFTNDWKFFKIPFTSLHQGGWGVPAPSFDASTLMSLAWQYPDGYWDIWLDDVSLYREKAQ